MAAGQTLVVDAFTLYVTVRAQAPVDDAAVWRVSVDCSAADLEGALELGHELAAEALGLCPVPGQVEEVAAMTDERQLVWREVP